MTFYYLAVWQVLNNVPKAKVFKLLKTMIEYRGLLEKSDKLVYWKSQKVSL